MVLFAFFTDLLESIIVKFHVTFIIENRWKFFVDGFLMTLLLSISSFLLGTLLGALFCSARLSRYKWLRNSVSSVTNFLVQLPTLVLLMVFVYVIFGDSSFSVVVIVIFGLTLKASAYITDIFYSAVTAVDSGEKEAALTLGLSKYQTFRYITLPQAIQSSLPLYKNQLVITIQETSIVGYLAILDLTRASDIVTARTYDALFGIIIISIFYLLLSKTSTLLLDFLSRQKHISKHNL